MTTNLRLFAMDSTSENKGQPLYAVAMVACSVCPKKVPTKDSWSRWNVYFCSQKCHNVRLKEELKKQEEEDEKQRLKDKFTPRWNGCDAGGGNAF